MQPILGFVWLVGFELGLHCVLILVFVFLPKLGRSRVHIWLVMFTDCFDNMYICASLVGNLLVNLLGCVGTTGKEILPHLGLFGIQTLVREIHS